jgi:TfoX/Sxy family transcriptional regulator of competence genes
MKWQKASEKSKKLIADAVDGVECEPRMMFGYPVFFINRNMFAGLFGNSVFIRHSDKVRKFLEKQYGTVRLFTPMPGRPMKDYAVLPAGLTGKRAELRKVVRMSAEHTRTLPPKEKKPAAGRAVKPGPRESGGER